MKTITKSKINLIGEIGINHNGDLEIAKKLIDILALAGFDYAKIQKRNPDVSTPEHKKREEKKVPWMEAPITYLEYKKQIEFTKEGVEYLSNYAKKSGIKLFSSVWDLDSAKEMKEVHKDIVKIPSAKITDIELVKYCRENFDFVIMSTGMSEETEIGKAVYEGSPDVVMHTNSVYPTPLKELKLGYIDWLKNKYPKIQVGYSSHYYGVKDLFIAIDKGIMWAEKHVTLSHTMWGSDQLSSIEPQGIFELSKAIRDFENIINDGYEPRFIYPGEEKKRQSLRK